MGTIFKAKAPAKLIISGEYAVIYGAPAIAMAIDRYITTSVSIDFAKTINNFNPIINFNLSAFKYAKAHPIKTLYALANRLRISYNDFLQDKINIKSVIKKPFELLQYSVANLLENLQLQLSDNLDITVDSGIPVGSGLGSSAAVIISCLRALAQLFKLNWDPNKFWYIGKEIENLQHGKSSGIDLYMSLYGGCYYFNGLENNKIILNNNNNFNIINTGIPLATTGECVAHVKNYINQNLIDQINNITKDIYIALTNNNQDNLLYFVRENHRLLCNLKIVPRKIQQFIKEIEYLGGAAKVCGAGSIYGDNAGFLLLLGELEKIKPVIKKYNYNLQQINLDNQGVMVV